VRTPSSMFKRRSRKSCGAGLLQQGGSNRARRSFTPASCHPGRVGAEHVHVAAQAADEVGLLGAAVFGRVAGRELGERGAGAAGEHEDRGAQRMRHVAVDEAASCMGMRKRRSHPATRRREWCRTRPRRRAADAARAPRRARLEGGRETVLAGQLREVELEHAQPAGQQRRGDLLDGRTTCRRREGRTRPPRAAA